MSDQQLIEQVAKLCMGWEKVKVDYFSTKSETQWQRDNQDWMEKVGLTQVGDYFVDVQNNFFIKCYDYNPLSSTPEGRSHAIELADVYGLSIHPHQASCTSPAGKNFISNTWQRAVCEAVVELRQQADKG